MSEKPEKIQANESNDQNVDKIREILFGEQIRDYDSRFVKLEQRLVAESEKMGQFLERRLTGIATATQRELAGLAQQLEDQKQRLANLQQESRSELESASHQIGERFNDLDDAFGKETRAIRNELGEHYNELIGLVRQTRESLDQAVQRESGRLEHDKVARVDLAALLAELAARLQQDGDGQ